jgi:carbamoyl-phosphate synthase large subunit
MGIPLLSHAWGADARTARDQAEKLGYPVLVRLCDQRINPPSDIFYGPDELKAFLGQYGDRLSELSPLFIKKFTDGMVGAQLLAVSDARDCLHLNFLENIEEYGIHSGDCAAINVALSVGEMPKAIAKNALKAIVRHFSLKGHVKLDLAVSGRQCFVTGVQPYPSPALALADKASSQDFHGLAARFLLGEKIDRSQMKDPERFVDYMVKESVFSFYRFPGLDPMLSSRMRSTGQVLGRDNSIGKAYYKSQLAVNPELPSAGNVFISARDTEKDSIFQIALKLRDLGFNLVSTQGTAHFLAQRGLKVTQVHKVSEQRPNIFDLIKNGEINLVINIPAGRQPKLDDQKIRRAAIEQNILLITTLSGAFLMVSGLVETAKSPLSFSPLAQGEDVLGS